MAAISDVIKSFFLRKSVLVRLIVLNVAIFIAIYLIAFLCRIFETESPVRLLELPSSWTVAILHVWSFATYMFIHYDIFHILFNMLWLYCFGIIFLDHYSNRSFMITYLIGGVAGAVFYLCASLIYPSVGLAGSSSAVLSIAAATAVRSPDYQINLFILGRVKIKWVAIVCFILYLFGSNLGVGAAHLGGALSGAVIALAAKRGLFDGRRIAKSNGMKRGVVLNPLHYKPVEREMTQAEIDREMDMLLIKVKKSGYDALTMREKKRLEELSKKLK